MKDERKIVVRDERLQKIRNNLREILLLAVWDEIEILRNYARLYPPPRSSTRRTSRITLLRRNKTQTL